MAFSEKAKDQLTQAGVAEAIEAVIAAVGETPVNEPADAKSVINQVTKALGVKKGLIMRSLRAALMGDMQGPDLVESWVILHRRGFDQQRLAEAVAVAAS
ncbi:MAG: hypothetical protein WBA01_18320 [Phormidesmis sp.]